MNPEQWLSLKWNGGSTMSDRWLNQSKIIHVAQKVQKILLKYQPFKSSLNIIEMTTKPMIIIIVPIITYVVGVILCKKFIINQYPPILC